MKAKRLRRIRRLHGQKVTKVTKDTWPKGYEGYIFFQMHFVTLLYPKLPSRLSHSCLYPLH